MLKLFVLLLCTLVSGYRQNCDEISVLQSLRIPTYEFSIRLLDRVALETDGHFVFSPISTWLQLLAVADGAQGETLNEVLNVTRLNMVCSRQYVKQIFNSLATDLSETIKRQSVLIIDKLLNVKDSFVNNVQRLNGTKVLQASFNRISKNINGINNYDITGIITEMLHDKDLRLTVLLLADIASLKVNWKSPFKPAYTHPEPFYSEEKVKIGYVNMMNQIGSFNFNYIPEIHAQAIELPFNDRTSMILLQPTKGNTEDLFWTMKDTRMKSILRILNNNGPRLINLKMPKFHISTDIDNVPELLHDMGLNRVFSPRLAELRNISDYRVYISMMANKFHIEVTETGVSAIVAPETVVIQEDTLDVTFNKPFVFILLDKVTNVILFAGIYSKPEVFN